MCKTKKASPRFRHPFPGICSSWHYLPLPLLPINHLSWIVGGYHHKNQRQQCCANLRMHRQDQLMLMIFIVIKEVLVCWQCSTESQFTKHGTRYATLSSGMFVPKGSIATVDPPAPAISTTIMGALIMRSFCLEMILSSQNPLLLNANWRVRHPHTLPGGKDRCSPLMSAWH